MIKCSITHNRSCLKCDKTEKYMMSIGAFVMCPKCFKEEFNTDEINPDTDLGKVYYMWLKYWKKKYV